MTRFETIDNVLVEITGPTLDFEGNDVLTATFNYNGNVYAKSLSLEGISVESAAEYLLEKSRLTLSLLRNKSLHL